MRELLGFLWFVSVAVLIGSGIGTLWLEDRLRRRLKRQHRETWEVLGSPHLIWNNSIQNTFRMRRFVKSGEYRTLNDKDLNRIVLGRQILEKGYLAAFGVAVVSMMILV